METTIDHKGYTIRIEEDTNPLNPFNYMETLGSITYSPRSRYVLGNETMEGEEVNRIHNSDKYISIRVFAYVHSGATIKAAETNPFHCPWDSGQSGIVYVSKEKVCKEYGWKKVTSQRAERIKEVLRGEVKLFDSYLSGEVYGYIVEDADENVIDSCWGFYGDPEESGCIEKAINFVDNI